VSSPASASFTRRPLRLRHVLDSGPTPSCPACALPRQRRHRFLADQFEHKDWQGFAFYDLIFPLFVFIVGVSLVFSLTRTLEREGRAAALRRVFRRGLLLYALGVFYYGGFAKAWPDIRLLGVLQRIALCYFFAGLLFCLFKPRALAGIGAGC
jgi:predicted acyltransferase